MASVSRDDRGWRIRFVDQNGKRRTLRPGKVDKRSAETIGRHIDSLVASKASGQPHERQTALWLGEIGGKLYSKLVKAELVESREPEQEPEVTRTNLLAFCDEFIADGKTLVGKKASASTKRKWKTARNHFEKHFGRRKMLEDVTPADAEKFRQYLESIRIKTTGEPMRENAWRKVIASSKVIFTKATRLELIERNPFAHEASSSVVARDRDYFVTPVMTEKLMEAAPDAQWRLIIALWRLAGLRKMEIHNLTWGDILTDQGRFRVRATKTAHIEGREVRYVPLAPVQKYFQDAWQAGLTDGRRSLPADAPVITRFAPTNVNLGKPFLKIIEAAGLKPWPKLIQNLRASCETEWLDTGMPAHVVANWIGHTVQVQNESYAQVDDHHFERFNNQHTEKVALIVAQQTSEASGIEENGERAEQSEHAANAVVRAKNPIKKLGPETELFALERSRTSTPITGT